MPADQNKPQRTLSPAQAREYRRWRNLMNALVSMEYKPYPGVSWEWECPHCGSRVRLLHPAINSYHFKGCAWQLAWASVPNVLRQEFLKRWEKLSREERHDIRTPVTSA